MSEAAVAENTQSERSTQFNSELSKMIKFQHLSILSLSLFGFIHKIDGGVQPEKRQSEAKMNGNVRDQVQMGVANDACDTGADSLEVDWLDNPVNYTCYHPTNPLLPSSLETLVECKELPKDYFPKHFCMNDVLSYNTSIPSFGDHRPIWPKFGEYRFVPPQRWLHNIEHGAVVMLYHPCTHPVTVDKLRSLVTGCIRKHVITPYTNMSEERPLALVAWGCVMSMSRVEEAKVVEFIRTRGLKGPEGTYPKEGQYTHQLQKLAEPPQGSDINDTTLCPNFV